MSCYLTCYDPPPRRTHDSGPEIAALHVDLQPATFSIPLNKSVKYSIQNNHDCLEQEVYVTCNSLLCEIRDPKVRNGVATQIYGILKKGETMVFELGLRDQNDTSSIPLSPLIFSPAGYLEICHYDAQKKSDSDWKNKPNEVAKYDMMFGSTYGRWKENLVLEAESEWVKKKNEEFIEKFQKALDDWELETEKIEKGQKKMMTDLMAANVSVVKVVEEKKIEKKKKRILGCC
ncbi:hypothetical protein CRE_14599 [Caenorhabditis remanei]|uniref:Uncharacterized protein n=1 Tax=Caenorhabditis remanei TaxID=31234 RepID=E3M9S8_CAERE|nr:hypothetical protein CRE_14599 [Caenorhabditis remanei]